MSDTPTRRTQRISEVLIAALSKQSDLLHAGGSQREELTHEAAKALLSNGINPTVALVRRITNLGSNDAIARDLDKWRAGIGDVLKQRSLKTEVPEPVIELVESMINGLWKGSLIEASQKFDEQRSEISAERDAAVDAERLARGLLEASHAEVQRLQIESTSKDEAITASESKAAGLESTVQELQKSIAHLERELARERDEREKERDRAAEELQNTHKAQESALAVVEGNRKYALVQLDSARANERTLAERVKSLEAERHLLDTQHRLAMNNLRDHQSKVVMENGVLKGTLQAREDELTRVLTRVKDLESRLQQDAEDQAAAAAHEIAEARKQTCQALETAARNDPAIFEYCDLNECRVVVALSDNNVPVYTIQLDKDGTTIQVPGTDLQSVIEFCKRHID